MPKEEAVVRLVMATEEDRGLPSKEGPIVDGIFPVRGGGEHSKAGAMGGRKKGDPVRAAAKVSGLKDEGVGVGDVRMEKGKRQVIKPSHVDGGHEGVDVARALSFLRLL
jgi:hypothetical protein